MRGSNKMPHGNKPSKRGLNANYICHISADVTAEDLEWICERAKKLNISKAEVLRRCIRGSKLYDLMYLSKSC